MKRGLFSVAFCKKDDRAIFSDIKNSPRKRWFFETFENHSGETYFQRDLSPISRLKIKFPKYRYKDEFMGKSKTRKIRDIS